MSIKNSTRLITFLALKRRDAKSAMRHRGAAALTLAAAVALTLSGEHSALAKSPTFKLLYTFTSGTDGAYPYAGMIRDKAGNLYGTTYEDGVYTGGTVFKLSPSGTLTTLYSFNNNGIDGAMPVGGVVADEAGNLYGATYGGGPNAAGTIFRVGPKGKEKVLYAFTGLNDGASPLTGLLELKGDFYGVTYAGGANQDGVVFKVAPNGKETVLHTFSGGKDGANPYYTALIADEAGNLYGTTPNGGANSLGVVYKLAPDGAETVLYPFAGGSDGANPNGPLILDKAGNLYGATFAGGTGGFGTVYKIAPNGAETVLYTFKGGNDGASPYGGLIADRAGNFSGTTLFGGGNGCGGGGCGTSFSLAPNGTETVVHSMNGMSDGANPQSTLIKDSYSQKGVYFGTTGSGGADGFGTIFSITK